VEYDNIAAQGPVSDTALSRDPFKYASQDFTHQTTDPLGIIFGAILSVDLFRRIVNIGITRHVAWLNHTLASP
jgi:hypothetical protein